MEKGVSKYWTPEAEEHYKRLLAGCHTFAERDLLMSIRDLLKYDGRTKAAKRATAQARLRLATATDEDLAEMANLQAKRKKGDYPDSVERNLKRLKYVRAELKEKGIKRSELACR